ncbi:thioredoxin family protein [Paenibacillus sacheonensis]|uniref:Thioredoxin n=1 Tax=Paenibacillus sacheonensis TaxID=742054 RepID=A0A7X4YL15_9BACL|nr:thioredoxin family protein [Paenibacillus sacheonensis]MBM7563083.1 thioredoxin 1 [Paenibacillus sacheonensis]NBC68348.1 thiol reductase thioredoxin [Paenibacillus sacheonensis]
MGIQHVDSAEQLANVTQEGIVLVNYGATHCPPCKALAPILEELEGEMSTQVRFAYVNCDRLPDAAASAGIMGTPTVIVYKNGEPMDKLVGLRPKLTYRLAAEKLI